MAAAHNISSIPILRGLSPTSASLVTDQMLHFYKTNDVIVAQNDVALHLVILLRGEAKVISDGVYLTTRRAGEIIGEQAILDHVGRSATVIAQGIVEALLIPVVIAEQLFEDPAFLRNVAEALSAKLREATAERTYRYRQHEQLFAEFSAHVSPEVMDRLLATGQRYGEPRFVEVVLLMADIRSFTTTCSRMEPNFIATELGLYLDVAVDVLHKNGAVIDKFIGDAVLAVWGLTPGTENATSAALNAARELIYSASVLRFGGEPIRIGVGLNAGFVFVGNVGNCTKRQFTVLGTPVNLTARLESHCKELHADVVAGPDFYKKLSDADRSNFAKQVLKDPLRGTLVDTVYTWSQPNVGTSGEAK
jgi:class 3 adenylate cyclase